MLLELVEILAVDDGVDGKRQARLAHPAGERQLLAPGRRDSCRCGRPSRARQSWRLSWTWSRPASPRRAIRGSSSEHAGGDQIAVEPGRAGVGDELLADRGARRARRRRDGPAGRRARPPRRARATSPRCVSSPGRARAPADWSSRGIAAGSDGSAPARSASGGARLCAHAVHLMRFLDPDDARSGQLAASAPGHRRRWYRGGAS